MKIGREGVRNIVMIFTIIINLILINISFAQLSSSFLMKDTVCLNVNFNLQNNSIDASAYIWDFCGRDLDSLQGFQSEVEVSGANFTSANTFVYDSGSWYGYVLSFLSNELYLMSYGESLENVPLISKVNNVGAILNGPYQLRLFKESGIWYGLIINSGDNKLLRLTFGNGLGQDITSIEDLGDFGSLNVPYGLRIVESNGDILAVIGNSAGNNVTLVNFGNSILYLI